MKIYVSHDGDRSVGIDGEQITIDWPMTDWDCEEERISLRKKLRKFWSKWLDVDKRHLQVRFEDECEDCGQRSLRRTSLKKYAFVCCTNPQCATNSLPEEAEYADPIEMGWVGKDGLP